MLTEYEQAMADKRLAEALDPHWGRELGAYDRRVAAVEKQKKELAEDIRAVEAASAGDAVPVHDIKALDENFLQETEAWEEYRRREAVACGEVRC